MSLRCQAKRCDDTGDFCQEFPADGFTLLPRAASLVVREAKLPPAKPGFEDSILLDQVDYGGLWVTLNPAVSDGDDQQYSRVGSGSS